MRFCAQCYQEVAESDRFCSEICFENWRKEFEFEMEFEKFKPYLLEEELNADRTRSETHLAKQIV